MKTLRTLWPLLAMLILVSCNGKGWKQDAEGVTVKVAAKAVDGPSRVRLQVIGDKLVRVTATPEKKFSGRKSLIIVPQDAKPQFSVSEAEGSVVLETSSVKACVRISDGAVSFASKEGDCVLDGNRMTFTPISVEGKDGYSTRLVFDSPDGEAFYGLGQQQSLEFNHKGGNEELYQYNTKVSVPFVVSSRNYGILVDNYSLSRWGNPEPYIALLRNRMGDKEPSGNEAEGSEGYL